MTAGEIAALIAATAFAALVVFLILKLNPILTQLAKTMDHVNVTIPTLTKDVDRLAVEVVGLLGKSSYLVSDISGKLQKTDPLFQAVGEIGSSVSDVNHSAKSLVASLTQKK